MIFATKPKQFNPRFEVVSCFFEYDGEVLFLQRQDHKPEGGTWGAPAGKIDQGETPEIAMARELVQETGFDASRKKLVYFRKLYVCYKTYDFVYHIFSLKLGAKPDVQLNLEEHKAYRWLSPAEALRINLIPDMDACIKLFYGI